MFNAINFMMFVKYRVMPLSPMASLPMEMIPRSSYYEYICQYNHNKHMVSIFYISMVFLLFAFFLAYIFFLN